MSEGHQRNTRVQQALAQDGTRERIESLYEAWAGEVDDDLRAEQYRAPAVMTALVERLRTAERVRPASDGPLRVVDAGCGTGLLGALLAHETRADVAGFDLSEAMVRQAQARGCYRRLWSRIDTNQPLARQLGESDFDLAVACGVFTLGHVPPEAMQRLLDIVRPGGIVLVSAPDGYARETGFNEACDELVGEGRATDVLHETGPYVADEDAHYRALARP